MTVESIVTDNRISLRAGVVVFLLLCLTPAIILFLTGKETPALMVLPLPALFVLVAWPRVTFYVYLLSVSFYLPYYIGTFAVWPFDVAMALLTFAVLVESLLLAKTSFERTPFDLPFWFLIAATWLSALFAYNSSLSVVPSMRILLIYVAFRVTYVLAKEIGVRQVVLFYVYQVFALAILNVLLFVAQGGKVRVYGPAWLAFENYSMTALPMALAFLLWARTAGERLRFALAIITIIVAVAGSGSRGSLVAIAIAVPILLVLAMLKMRREGTFGAGRALRKVLVVGGAAAVILLLAGTLFGDLATRIGQLVASVSHPQGTVALRIVLWTAALKAFMTSPLVGIGIGNFHLVDQVVPAMKTNPVWFYIKGMSAHNVLLHYMAETGLFGAMSLIALAATGFKAGHRFFKTRMEQNDTQVSAALFITMIVFCATILFMRAWTWAQEGHILAILFGLVAAWNYECTHDNRSNVSASDSQ